MHDNHIGQRAELGLQRNILRPRFFLGNRRKRNLFVKLMKRNWGRTGIRSWWRRTAMFWRRKRSHHRNLVSKKISAPKRLFCCSWKGKWKFVYSWKDTENRKKMGKMNFGIVEEFRTLGISEGLPLCIIQFVFGQLGVAIFLLLSLGFNILWQFNSVLSFIISSFFFNCVFNFWLVNFI